MSSFFRKLILLSLALLVPLLAMAGEGRIPIYDKTFIAAPGKYVVTQNITPPVCGPPVIFVAVSDVDLDLNGFVLTACEGDAVIKVNGVDNVTIRNGTLKAGNWGIQALGVATGSHKLIVEDVKILNNASYGISMEQFSDFVLQRNSISGITGAGGQGIYINGGGGGRISENVIQRTAASGIHLAASNDNLLLHNVVSATGLDGLLIDGQRNQITWNLLNANGGYGLHFSAASGLNTFGKNTARGNPGGVCLGGGATTDYCNEGAGNSSFNDNFLPGLF